MSAAAALDDAVAVRSHSTLRLVGWWLGSVAVAVVHNGLWATPNLAAWSLIAGDLGRNPFVGPTAPDYLLTSVTTPVVAHVLGQGAPHAFARLHLVILVAGWAAAVAVARSRFGYRTARNLTILLAAAPVVTVSMQWLGQPDPLTMSMGLLMTMARRRWIAVTAAIVAGLTHPEQAIFMAAVAAAVSPLLDDPLLDDADTGRPAAWGRQARETAIGAAWLVGGVILGRLVTEVYLRIAGVVIARPRTDFLTFGARRFYEFHTQQPLALVVTLWGPLWLVIAAVAVLRVVRRGRDPVAVRRWSTIAVLAAVSAVPVAVTLDETRVYAVITVPLLIGAAVAIDRELGSALDRIVVIGATALLVVSLVIPGGFATGVTTWRPAFDQTLMRRFLVDGEHPGDLSIWLLEPLDVTIPALD